MSDQERISKAVSRLKLFCKHAAMNPVAVDGKTCYVNPVDALYDLTLLTEELERLKLEVHSYRRTLYEAVDNITSLLLPR